jgi:hypothetical protein
MEAFWKESIHARQGEPLTHPVIFPATLPGPRTFVLFGSPSHPIQMIWFPG